MLQKTPLSAAILAALCCSPVFAAQIIVNTPYQTAVNECALGDAIIAANTDLATGGCSAGSGSDDILLGSYSFELAGIVDADTGLANFGLPAITSEISLSGDNAEISQADDANPITLLHVSAGGNLDASGLTISGAGHTGLYVEAGKVTLYDVTLRDNAQSALMLRDHAFATILNSQILNNKGYSNTAVGGIDMGEGSTASLNSTTVSGNEGGVGCGFSCNDDEPMTLNITDSDISNNGSRYLGGISAWNVYLTVSSSRINNNSTWQGTPVSIGERDASITDSVISGNSAYYAAALVAGSHTLISRSSILDNECLDVCNAAGIDAASGAVIVNSTISGNSGRFTGGVYLADGATLLNSTVVNNSTSGMDGVSHPQVGGVATERDDNQLAIGAATVANTIIANNGGDLNCQLGTGSTLSHNLVSDGSCNAEWNGDPGLSAIRQLANGSSGYFPTDSSIVIDAGNPVYCRSATLDGLDQAGAARSQDGNNDGYSACDLGAVEVAAVVDNGAAASNGVESDNDESRGGGGSLGAGLSLFALPMLRRRKR